jgi:predicted kinase
MSILIIIRGNSGSGKSTIAKELRSRFADQKVAVIGQDYLRRNLLGEIGRGGDDNVELIELTARFALEKDYITILEGILPTEYYGDMLRRLNAINPKDTYYFYLDIPIEETLVRHQTKTECNEFGEEQMREWYRQKDVFNLENEKIIDEHSTLEDSVEFILTSIK